MNTCTQTQKLLRYTQYKEVYAETVPIEEVEEIRADFEAKRLEVFLLSGKVHETEGPIKIIEQPIYEH